MSDFFQWLLIHSLFFYNLPSTVVACDTRMYMRVCLFVYNFSNLEIIQNLYIYPNLCMKLTKCKWKTILFAAKWIPRLQHQILALPTPLHVIAIRAELRPFSCMAREAEMRTSLLSVIICYFYYHYYRFHCSCYCCRIFHHISLWSFSSLFSLILMLLLMYSWR